MSTFRRNFLFSALKPLLRDSTQCLEVDGILDLRAGGPHRPGTISSGLYRKGKTSAVGAMEHKATTHVGSWLSLSCVPSPAKQVGTSRFRAEAMGNENSAPPAAGAWPDLQHKKRNATAELGRDRPGAETAAPLLKWMQNEANEAAVRTMVPAPSSENLYKHEAMGQLGGDLLMNLDETSVPLLKWIKNDPDEAAVKMMVPPPSSENLLKHKATGQLGGTLFSKQTETANPSLVKRIATAADEASAEAATKLLSAPPSGCLYKLKSKDQPGRNHPRLAGFNMIKAADPLMEHERMSQRATTPAPAPASHSPASAPVPVPAPFTASTQQSPTSALVPVEAPYTTPAQQAPASALVPLAAPFTAPAQQSPASAPVPLEAPFLHLPSSLLHQHQLVYQPRLLHLPQPDHRGGFAGRRSRDGASRSPSCSRLYGVDQSLPAGGFDVNTFWHARWDASSTSTTSPPTSEMAESTPVEYEDRNGEVKVLREADLIGSSHDTRSHGVSTNVVELGYHPGEGSDEGGCSHSKDEEEADPSDRTILHAPPALPVFGVDLTGDGKLGFGFTSADELEEVDIGPGDKPRPTFISRKLDPQLRSQMIALLKEYPDCFAWDYTEMPGLDRSIIEHRLPLKKGFRPFQQRARQMKAEILEEVKKEIEKMLAAGFIRPCRYAEWISSIVPVEKKDGRWRVAIDFRDLNRATPKDEYPMPVAETLINAAAGHKVLSFMDGNAGYNQIFMAPEDIHKTAFRVPGAVGLFEYVVMTFGLKNAGATYQRAMNYIFHDLIGKLVEIYIDDVVVKSVSMEGHLEDLRHVLDRTRKFGLRMNPKKCAFGVTAGQFLGFLVHERGIEIGLKSQEAVRTMQPPTTKKELQRLIGKINFVRRFISNLSGRIEPFMGLVKTKSDDEFHWGAEQQQAFDDIKRYLTTPPVLVPPQQDRPFYIYLSVADTSIASVVVQLYEGVERVVFYLSRRMLDAETRYPEVEKLCLCLVFTCTKLHHILLTAEIFVICKSDVVKHMLSAPVLKGRLGKWMLALSEFDLRYQPAKAVKGQALADLIAERINTNIAALSIRAWAMFFDGSACDGGCGIGILLVSPRGTEYSFSIRLSTPCTNNVAEYEAIRKGMELLLEAGAEAVELFGDSKLVINQLTDEYKCESESLFPYWMECRELMTQFRYINFNWVPRSQNTEANNLAQMASGYIDTPEGSEVQVQFLEQDDWRAEIFKYLKDSARGAPKRIRYKAMKYVLIGDDMFYRTLEGLLLKCLGPTESNRLLHEVHEGACGTHQSAHKMKWLIRRSGFYWPTMLEDCFNYYKGCQACQMFGKIQMVPASAMNPIIKPWPFRGWGMDMIGKIHPASSKKHEWILAITDYFTKWVEAVPMKKVKSEDVIKFVKEHVIHRFGIPQTITTDGGSVFVSKEFRGFCDDMGIKLIRSSPYYAQANGQAEASNQSLIKLIKRKIEENPRDWHEKLSEALWAYRMSCHGAIKTSPYQLVYGQEAVLPWEITAGSRRVTFQDDLTADEYATLMSDTIEDATELRLWSLEKIKENKARVARAYNKKVRPKEFQVGDLVWEAVLPLGTRDKAYGKWSPNWHGPYKVVQALKGNAYMLEELDGQKFPVAVNGQHLKKYFPSMWDDGH
ncbi:hypothetical protein QYE76_019631 [Lolium multiflorum]|uniref:Uncharacterized protein n=1 Tax=Lolium multiflorum TaxID=4521 RepID=A0AAD8R6W0_LOLMU|nr:hypothetical protein QYE76_019631 [Lolium multiflorum]